MRDAPAAAPSALCPYGCGGQVGVEGEPRGYCSGCAARVRTCTACAAPGRALATFCRGCGARIEPLVDWSCWGGGAHGSGEWDGAPGAGTGATDATGEGSDVWAKPYQCATEVGTRAALLAGLGQLFFIDMTGRLHAISMGNGQGRIVAQGLVPDSTPALDGRQLIALAPDGVRLFEAHPPPSTTPDLVWIEKARAPLDHTLGVPVGGPTLARDSVVIAMAAGEDRASLVGLDRHGLAHRWHVGPLDGSPLPQSVRGDFVAWGATAGTLLLAHRSTGAVLARSIVPEGLYWPPPLPILCDRGDQARALALDGNGALVALDATGTLTRPGMTVEEPASMGLSAEGFHVGSRGDASVMLYDPHGRSRVLGPVRMGATGRADSVLPQMICAGDTWIAGTQSGMIGAISRLAGGMTWRVPVLFTPGGLLRSFLVVEGRAFALSDTGEVRALALGLEGRRQ